MKVEAFLERLEAVRARGTGKWSARCPAHTDKSPSLSVAESDQRILVHCFAGCDIHVILTALNLAPKDLFFDVPIPQRKPPFQASPRVSCTDIVFQFELSALDRRLRAEQVLKAVATFNGHELKDMQRERLMNAVATAYRDRDRAEFLESVADDFKAKVFQKREERDAA